MTNFIKVHPYTDKKNREMWVNPDHIINIEASAYNPKLTDIYTSDENRILVTDSVEEVVGHFIGIFEQQVEYIF